MYDMLKGEKFVAVSMDERNIEVRGGQTICPCTFTPEIQGSDGVILKFAKGIASKVQKIAEGWEFTDMIIAGDGWLLRHGFNGEISLKQVDAVKELEPITYGNGDVVAYIAGKGGLEVFGINCPPFKDGVTELDISEEDPIGQSLKPEFWQLYKFLSANLI